MYQVKICKECGSVLQGTPVIYCEKCKEKQQYIIVHNKKSKFFDYVHYRMYCKKCGYIIRERYYPSITDAYARELEERKLNGWQAQDWCGNCQKWVDWKLKFEAGHERT